MGRSRRDAGRSPRACPAARSDRSRDRGRPWMAARSTTRPCCGTSPTTRAHPGHSRDRQVGAWRRGMVAKRLRRRKDGARPRGPSCSSRPGLPTRATSPTPPGRAVEGWITRLKPRATGEAFRTYGLLVLTGSPRGAPLEEGSTDCAVGNSGAASSNVPLGEHATNCTDGIEDRQVDNEHWALLMSLVGPRIE